MTRSGFIIFLALVLSALTVAAYIIYLTYQEDYVQVSTEQPIERSLK